MFHVRPATVIQWKSLTMFGRVIFLLYLPAICLSFALFPNGGHETQRRQIPEENVASGQAEGPCFQRLTPCMHNLRHMFAVYGPEELVLDGRLVVPCDSNTLEESRSCINAASECRNHHLYEAINSTQMSWDFVCKNSQAFVSGEGCWRSSQVTPTILTCLNTNTVCVPTCVSEGVAKTSDCSEEEANLLGDLAATVLGENEAPC